MPLTARLVITLFVTWLLLSGLFNAQFLVLDVLSVALVAWLALRLNVLQHRGQPLYFRPYRLLRYWGWLLVEILRSNIDVCRRALAPALPIAPALRTVVVTPATELGIVIYANSITLTPGTTAISFRPGGGVLVHALDTSSLDELDTGALADRVLRLEPDIAPLRHGAARYGDLAR